MFSYKFHLLLSYVYFGSLTYIETLVHEATTATYQQTRLDNDHFCWIGVSFHTKTDLECASLFLCRDQESKAFNFENKICYFYRIWINQNQTSQRRQGTNTTYLFAKSSEVNEHSLSQPIGNLALGRWFKKSVI